MGNFGKTEEQVERLRETITEIAVLTENVKIKCPAKLITYAFIDFNDNHERNKYVRSANMLRKVLRWRKFKISQSMDADERFHQKRLGYIKCCIHTRHGISLASMSMNRYSNQRVVSRWTDCGKNMSERLPQVTTSIKTSNQKLKITWTNGWQKRRND